MSNNVVPEKLINFRAYNDGNDLLGVTDVQLPSLDAMTETVKGAGIAGEVDSPVLGHFGSMETVLNWRTISKPGMNLASQKGVSLDLRGAQQFYDPEKSEYVVKAVKCVIRGVPKKTELGKLDVGTTTGSSNTIETNYIKVIIAVVKAYSSAVGAGEFVSEIFGEEAVELRRRAGVGGEFFATTGRLMRIE